MSISKFTLACAMMAGVLVGVVPVEAQRYYARERIVGMSNQPSYSPVYGSFGACASGSRSAPVTGCVTADGTPGPSTACSQTPKTETCSSLRTCGAFTLNSWPQSRSDLGFFAASSMTEAQGKAKVLCENTTKTGVNCGVTSGYGTQTCISSGVAVPAGTTCYGAVIGPSQSLQQPGSNYANAVCS